MSAPIYVINMAKDVARMDSMARQLQGQGLEFARVEATAGRDISVANRAKIYSAFWFYVFHGRQATANELGCTLSHRKAWQTMLDQGQDWAVFFEDDAELSPEFSKSLVQFEFITRDFELVQFHSFRVPSVATGLATGPYQVKKFRGTNASAVAYILRASGARKLLRGDRVYMNADKWVWARALLGLRTCAIYPFPAWPHEEHSAVSSIDQNAFGMRKSSAVWRIVVLPWLRVVRGGLLWWRGI